MSINKVSNMVFCQPIKCLMFVNCPYVVKFLYMYSNCLVMVNCRMMENNSYIDCIKPYQNHTYSLSIRVYFLCILGPCLINRVSGKVHGKCFNSYFEEFWLPENLLWVDTIHYEDILPYSSTNMVKCLFGKASNNCKVSI